MDLWNSNSSNITEVGPDEETSLVIVGFLLLLGFCMMLMNGVVVCCGIMYRAKLNSAYSLQILSLSLSDFVVGMTAIPLTLMLKYSGRETDFALCAPNFIMYMSMQSATMYHILGICLHRLFIAAFKRTPGHSRSSYKRVVGYVVLTWIICPITLLVPFLNWGRTGQTLEYCSVKSILKENFNKGMKTLSGIILVPLILINLFYMVLISYLKQMKRRAFRVAPSDSSHKGLTPPMDPLKRNGDLDGTALNPIAGTSASASDGVHSTALGGTPLAHQDLTRTDSTDASNRDDDDRGETPVPLTKHAGASNSGGKRHSHMMDVKASTSVHAAETQKTEPSTPVHWNAAKTIGIILLLLNLCTLPMVVVFLFEANNEDRMVSSSVMGLSILALMMNSCLNPVVYTVRMRPFRKCLVEMLTKFIRNISRLIPDWCVP